MKKGSKDMMLDGISKVGKYRIVYLKERIKELNQSAEEVDNNFPKDKGLLMTIKSEINQANSLIKFYKGELDKN